VESSTLPPESEEITDNDLMNAVRAGRPQFVDTRAQIVRLLTEVGQAKITAEEFYQKVSKLEMPPDKELRHALMEVKKDIGNYLGEEGIRKVFGEIYPSGATRVEATILAHRKAVVMETIKLAIVAYREKVKAATGEYPKMTFYYGEVGGWSKETFEELKFAGDIDFNFLSGDLDQAMELKKIFDEMIMKRYGRTPEELDVPCTVHGMATGEVYVGKHGQSFAEDVTNVAWEIDLENASPDMDLKAKSVPFKEALETMVLEARMAAVNNAISDLKTSKWPYQPGISLEMIRHFEHDIAGKNVFTDLESFVKAAKYTDRSFSFLIKELGEGVVIDQRLADFTKKLGEIKNDPKAQVKEIKKYFEDIGKSIPFEVNLKITADGKGRATIEANEKFIKDFWDMCRQAMWGGANQVLKKKTDDLKRKIDALTEDNLEESKKIYEELVKLDEMLEVEDRILNDEVAGVHNLDPEYKTNMEEFRSTRKKYKQKSAQFGHVEYIDPKLGKSYAWIEKMLEAGKEENIKMAGAALMSVPGKFNDALDFIDDGLMTTLRNGEGDEYIKILRKGQGLYWDEQVNQFLRGTPWEGRFDSQFQGYEEVYNQKIADISKWFNDNFESRLASRGLQMVRGAGSGAIGAVQKINTTFNDSVSNSRVGGAMMQAMMIYNLKDELPLYWNYLMKDDWEGFAAEFFKRRVPLGGAVERYQMGDYYGVAWEMTSTIIPPLALVAAAKSVGECVTAGAIDAYISEELETFIDNLYEGAEFKIAGVETVGEDLKISHWNLVSVTYSGRKFEYDELISLETADAREMADCLQKPSDARAECFPMEKVGNGLFEWWRNRDAFERAFMKSDPWVQVILEMKKHPDVGEKLMDHYGYQLHTRLEQIKVQFLKKTKEKLEARRSAEQASLSGKFTKMYEELFETAKDLDIHVQLQEAMDEEFGGGVWQFMASVKDYIRGTLRQLKGDVDVWDIYEELSVFVTKNLSTYKAIATQRDEAEAALTYGKEDQGLRILTGPYFLKGKESEDASESKRWRKLPEKVNQEMSEKMKEIKKEVKADPAALELTEGAYDRGILEQLVYHESFTQMWIWVNGNYKPDRVPSYLGKNPSTQDEPNVEGIINDSDRAVSRVELHTRRTNEILAEFRRHYESLKKEGQKKEDEENGENEGLLARIQELEALARTGVAAMDGDYDLVEQGVKAFEKERSRINKNLGKLDKLIDSVEKRARTVDEKLALAERDADQAKIQDDQAVMNREEAQNHALKCCEAAERVKQTVDVAQLISMIQDVRYENGEVKIAEKAFKENLSIARSASENAQKIKQEMLTIGDDVQTIKSQIVEAQNAFDAIQSDLVRLEGLSASLAAKAVEIASYKAQGAAIYDQIVTINAAMKAREQLSSTDKELEKSIARVLGQMNGHEKRASNLKDKVKEKIASEVKKLEGLSEKMEKTKGRIDGLEAMPQVGDEILIQFEQYAQEATQAFSSVEIFEDSVSLSAQQSAICLKAAEKHFIAETSPQAQVAKANCSAYLGTSPVWNAGKKAVECACPNGQTWNASQNRCVVLEPINAGGGDTGAADLIKSIQGIINAANNGVPGGGSSDGGYTGGASSGSSSGGGGETCASPGRWDGSCCRCPDGLCEFLGQGCN